MADQNQPPGLDTQLRERLWHLRDTLDGTVDPHEQDSARRFDPDGLVTALGTLLNRHAPRRSTTETGSECYECEHCGCGREYPVAWPCGDVELIAQALFLRGAATNGDRKPWERRRD